MDGFNRKSFSIMICALANVPVAGLQIVLYINFSGEE